MLTSTASMIVSRPPSERTDVGTAGQISYLLRAQFQALDLLLTPCVSASCSFSCPACLEGDLQLVASGCRCLHCFLTRSEPLLRRFDLIQLRLCSIALFHREFRLGAEQDR